MSPPNRILAPIGLASAEAAALAALVAEVPAAHGTWRLGDAAEADLVLVDLDTTDGVIGQADAITQDIPCVALDVPGGLARPFSVGALAAVLAAVPARSRPAPFESVLMSSTATAIAGPLPRSDSGTDDAPIARGSFQYGLADPADETEMSFEQLFSADLVGRIPDGNAGSSTVAIEGASGAVTTGIVDGDARGSLAPVDVATETVQLQSNAPDAVDGAVSSVAQVAQPGDGAGVAGAAAEISGPLPTPAVATGVSPVGALGASATAEAVKPVVPKASYPLIEYLTGKLIGLPSRIAPPGLPALVLDPQRQVFHAEGELATLAGYLDLPLQRTQWLAVLPSQLAELRTRVPARPYTVLRFYHGLRGAGRSLAAHLDPGGTYALRGELPLNDDLPRAQRVLAALAMPRGLAEIASQSGTSVVEVYEVVSALDAIGQLAWTPRKRPGAR